MYFFLSSKDCLDSHPHNYAWDFTVDIKRYIPLKGMWTCSLMDIDYDGEGKDLYIFSDLCTPSYVTSNHLPVLRVVNKPNPTFYQPYFIPVSHDYVDRIRIYIRTRTGEIPSFTPKLLRYPLYLQCQR